MTELVGLLSLGVITVINGYWTWQSRKVQNDRDVIKALQIQLTLKEEAIEEMRQKKNEIKAQYHHQLALSAKLEGELKTYKEFHKHA
jgi:hypothetical protein